MSEYAFLTPLFASSVMYVTTGGHFLHRIVYDYVDKGKQGQKGSLGTKKFIEAPVQAKLVSNRRQSPHSSFYIDFLENQSNYEKEIDLYWNNLQDFLGEEKNLVNGVEVKQEITACSIHFRDRRHPFVQWVVEFAGPVREGPNTYENFIEPEELEYPIQSTYIFEPPLVVSTVETSLNYQILRDGHIVEFSGETGRKLGSYEKIEFRW
ncbi:MAG TPA: hypothetical protein VKK79_02345 [Candidatus Lokiarchaeia archaeon]|nr:hypothetical protein [Candidatus Lokiarchaeia archaeon]